MHDYKRILRTVNTDGHQVKTHVMVAKVKEEMAVIIVSRHLIPVKQYDASPEYYTNHKIVKTFKDSYLLEQSVGYKAETFVGIYDAVYDIFEKAQDVTIVHSDDKEFGNNDKNNEEK